MSPKIRFWTEQEDRLLIHLISAFPSNSMFSSISSYFKNRSNISCMKRYLQYLDQSYRSWKWKAKEENKEIVEGNCELALEIGKIKGWIIDETMKVQKRAKKGCREKRLKKERDKLEEDGVDTVYLCRELKVQFKKKVKEEKEWSLKDKIKVVEEFKEANGDWKEIMKKFEGKTQEEVEDTFYEILINAAYDEKEVQVEESKVKVEKEEGKEKLNQEKIKSIEVLSDEKELLVYIPQALEQLKEKLNSKVQQPVEVKEEISDKPNQQVDKDYNKNNNDQTRSTIENIVYRINQPSSSDYSDSFDSLQDSDE